MLLYGHEREREAQLVVADVIADRATRLLDQLIVAPSSSSVVDGGTAQAAGPTRSAVLGAAQRSRHPDLNLAAQRSPGHQAPAPAQSIQLAWCQP